MARAKEMVVGWFSVHHLDRDPRELMGLVLLAAVLTVAAGVGMAYVAGFGAVGHRLTNGDWGWVGPGAGATALAFCGYYFAYRGVARAEGGPEIESSALRSVVAAGFGGLLAHGATAIDEAAMRAGGADKREANVRVSALAAFEHGVLALIVCPASIVALAIGASDPRSDYTWPWAVIPPLGVGVGIWMAHRYRGRFRAQTGWRRNLAVFIDASDVIFAIFRNPREHFLTVAGMAVYWGADMFVLWTAIAVFGIHMSALTTIVCFGTGMIFTRRTGPLGGAGIIYVALVASLWNGGGVPLAAGTLGVAVYVLLTFWLPLPATLATLPELRALRKKAERTGRRRPGRRREPAKRVEADS